MLGRANLYRMSDATAYLRRQARRIAAAYQAFAVPRAILLVGSAASGDADEYSDIDLLLYYEEVPSDECLTAAREQLGVERSRISSRDDASIGERYYLDGVECQIAHVTVGRVEEGIKKVVVELDLSEVRLKIMSGLCEGVPLHGEDLIERWRAEARITEKLQRAMIERRWNFFPWWYFEERLRLRDATLWRYDVLVQAAYNIVGVLAAVNRLYFSTLEFKRPANFLSRLEIALPDIALRLDTLFESDEATSTSELERLVRETATIVSARFPDMALTVEWAGIPTPPGSRESPWRLAEPDEPA